jgi:hypothetical protein
MNMLFGYIDVALGSMVLQAMAGMVLAGIVMGRRMIFAPLAWFRKDSENESEDDLLGDSKSSTDG